MKEFILENWRWLISLIIGVLSVILLCFKKRYKVYNRSIELFICEKLPMAISTAEKMFSAGSQKNDFCVSLICELIEKEFPGIHSSFYCSYIRKVIEAILSCPQKKEVSDISEIA